MTLNEKDQGEQNVDQEVESSQEAGQNAENSQAQEQPSKSDADVVKEQKKRIFQLEQDVFSKTLENESLRKKQSEVEEKLSSIRDYVKKMESEVEAVRVRAKRDQEKEIDNKLSSFLSGFLDVMENLKRSLESSGEASSLQEGVQLIAKQMEDCLKAAGVQRMNSEGSDFDPHQHEALTVQPVDTDEQDGKVIQVITEGYLFKEQVLKPAQVIVGKK